VADQISRTVAFSVVLFVVKLKHQPNGQTVGSGYLGTYGASFNTAAVAAAAAGQTGQYPYGSGFSSPTNTASSSSFSSTQQVRVFIKHRD